MPATTPHHVRSPRRPGLTADRSHGRHRNSAGAFLAHPGKTRRSCLGSLVVVVLLICPKALACSTKPGATRQTAPELLLMNGPSFAAETPSLFQEGTP